ncbi:hypothetical protein CIPAW_03G218300 [Carya illinoinensis]|uniref:Uncharacterized protein n=1 Tax=Carya illinoinensis TaxID=32201 RepID=A0A8T1R6B4_CARIL|nr:hypothetical protein CIPAW_03G218300 [Carya illinoinensis]
MATGVVVPLQQQEGLLKKVLLWLPESRLCSPERERERAYSSASSHAHREINF